MAHWRTGTVGQPYATAGAGGVDVVGSDKG